MDHTSPSPLEAKFYGLLRLICSVKDLCYLKGHCISLGYYTIPVGLNLFWDYSGIISFSFEFSVVKGFLS